MTDFLTDEVPAGALSGLDAQRRVASLGRILGVWAHPDDETYLMGGLLAIAAANGQPTACITATAGEHGTDDPVAWPPHRLAAERRGELDRALDTLSVGHHIWLDYEDGRCAEVDEAEGARALLDHIDRFAPDTIVTFGPDGITAHPDHVAVGRWVARATSHRERPTLLHAAKRPDWMASFASLHERIGAMVGALASVDSDRVVLDLELDDAVLARKVAALDAQATQVAPVIEAVGRRDWEAWVRRETFVDGWRSPRS